MKLKWAKVKPGQTVALGGREWLVESNKPKGKKRRKVAVRSGAHAATSTVEADEKVRIVERLDVRSAPSKKSKPAPRKPPKPADGDPWETQQDRIEKKLDKMLGARLVGEATNVDAGYYVPMVDATTIAAHLVIFHGGIPEDAQGDEQKMIEAHARAHMLGAPDLHLNHWHTENRPTRKKGK